MVRGPAQFSVGTWVTSLEPLTCPSWCCGDCRVAHTEARYWSSFNRPARRALCCFGKCCLVKSREHFTLHKHNIAT